MAPKVYFSSSNNLNNISNLISHKNLEDSYIGASQWQFQKRTSVTWKQMNEQKNHRWTFFYHVYFFYK